MIQLICGDALDEMSKLPDNCIDSIFSDPPYPGIKRDYGYWTESEWLNMMKEVVHHSRRILKPKGSAVFILQPNSEHVGQMRLWLWEFMFWAGKEWNIIQDVYWWNFAAMPNVHCARKNGLMRPSIKYCLWVGNSNCYRNQQEILWNESIANAVNRSKGTNDLIYNPSGYSVRRKEMGETVLEKGGVSPFNLIPMSNESYNSAGYYNHGAGTPLRLTKWWLKYITPCQGTVLDMFSGTGTTGVAAKQLSFDYIGIERMEKYHKVANYRIERALSKSKPNKELFIDPDIAEEINLF